ncbi:oxidoreductase [Virgisporangium aliadipatigenens]|uniref:Oxidoreductase n=1 Tax=Virgisporangium aliadipatigenens TaxID=741659 RepID=A0A8J3YJ53_9ACTN|nr:FAD binding domain-containing protein [Virgisporangium aliadipatigenens]GIJ46279.1 oxidoreductase [Virgisporangium aliadipatigenens]
MSEFRAGGTDLSERRRSGISRGPVRDVGARPELRRITATADGGWEIGAATPMAVLAADEAIRSGYPGLALSAGALATPQIRRIGTIGGNLLQHNRCWYYRNPHTPCLKSGGDTCPARAGNHRFHVAFDLGPCVAPHPSTLGAALLAYAAEVVTDRRVLPVAEVFGDGSDGSRDHRLADGELLTAVRLPPAVAGERAAYHRAISRTYAEWPLVEAVARLVVLDGTVAAAGVAVGGVAPIPLRLPAVEAALLGNPPTGALFEAAARRAADGARPLPMTGYKVPLLVGTVLEVLERAGRA